MTGVFQPHWPGEKFDPTRCKASVHNGGRSVGFHQCSKAPKADGWCSIHHPEAEAKRNAELSAKYARQTLQSNAKWARQAAGTQALALLPSIPPIHAEACASTPTHPDRECDCWVSKRAAILASIGGAA